MLGNAGSCRFMHSKFINGTALIGIVAEALNESGGGWRCDTKRVPIAGGGGTRPAAVFV